MGGKCEHVWGGDDKAGGYVQDTTVDQTGSKGTDVDVMCELVWTYAGGR